MSLPSSGFISPVVLDPAEEARLVQEILAVRPVVQDLCYLFYGEQKVRMLRRDFADGETIHEYLTEDEIAALSKLEGISAWLLPAFTPMAIKFTRKYVKTAHHPVLDYDDYFQEACMAISDVPWYYNGSSALSTYIHHAISHRLQDAARLGPLSMIGQKAYRMRATVAMAVSNGSRLEEVFGKFELSPEQTDTIRKAMAHTMHTGQIGSTERSAIFDIPQPNDEGESEAILRLRDAIEKTQLSSFQRDLLNEFLQGDPGFQTRVAERNIDSRTGKPYREDGKEYSRQSASQHWRKAIASIKKTLADMNAA